MTTTLMIAGATSAGGLALVAARKLVRRNRPMEIHREQKKGRT
jgi:HAMP domain-containing protein